MSDSMHRTFLPFSFKLSIWITDDLEPIYESPLKCHINLVSQVPDYIPDKRTLIIF